MLQTGEPRTLSASYHINISCLVAGTSHRMRHCASALASFPRRDLCIVGPVLDATAQLGRSVATWTCARGFVLVDACLGVYS